jgi:hypothetical protein
MAPALTANTLNIGTNAKRFEGLFARWRFTRCTMSQRIRVVDVIDHAVGTTRRFVFVNVRNMYHTVGQKQMSRYRVVGSHGMDTIHVAINFECRLSSDLLGRRWIE